MDNDSWSISCNPLIQKGKGIKVMKTKDKHPFKIKTGLNGALYAVFSNCYELYKYQSENPKKFKGCRIVCFGQFDNAFQLTNAKKGRKGYAAVS